MNLLLAIFAATLLILTLASGWIKERFWGSEALACLVVGFAIGPMGLGLFALDPAQSSLHRNWWEQATRLTVSLSVMSASLTLPRDYFRQRGRPLLIVLGPGMIAMWAASSLIGWAALGLTLPLALVLGAVLTPTDPVLARSIVSGRVARRYVPAQLRNDITGESGINDGLALPFVLIAIVIAGHGESLGATSAKVAWAVFGAIALGWVLGKGSGWLFRRAHDSGFAETRSLTATTLALSLLVLASVALLKADGILAVFVAGVMLNRAMKAEHQRAHEHFVDAVDRSFTLPIFILLGLSAPVEAWLAMGWPLFLAGCALILLRRLPPWLALRTVAPVYDNMRQTLFAGWFGPMGVAALFYACLALERTEASALWTVTSFVVCLSVLIYGISATPLTRLYRTAKQTGVGRARS